MSLLSGIRVPDLSKLMETMLSPTFARRALLPALSGGAIAGVGAYQILADANVTQGRTLLTGYIASGVALSMSDILPDAGSLDEAGAVLIGGTAAGFIVNAAFGVITNADIDADGTLSDAEKLTNYELHFAPIARAQRLYASIISGVGVAIAGYVQMARGYTNVQ